MTRFVSMLILVFMISGCAMMEYDGDQNNDRIAKMVMSNIFGRPVKEVFRNASKKGNVEYVTIELPGVEFQKYDFDTDCDRSHGGLMLARVERYKNPVNPRQYLINIRFGRLLERRVSKDKCVALDELGNMTKNDMGPEMHYVYISFLTNLALGLRDEGLPLASFRSQCFEDKLDTRLRHAPRERLFCQFDAVNRQNGYLPTLYMSKIGGSFLDFGFQDLLIDMADEDKSLHDIYGERMLDDDYRSRIFAVKNEVEARTKKELKKEQDWVYANRNRLQESGGDAEFLGKLFAVGAVGMVAAGSDMSALQKATLMEATTKDVMNDTGGTNLQGLKNNPIMPQKVVYSPAGTSRGEGQKTTIHSKQQASGNQRSSSNVAMVKAPEQCPPFYKTWVKTSAFDDTKEEIRERSRAQLEQDLQKYAAKTSPECAQKIRKQATCHYDKSCPDSRGVGK